MLQAAANISRENALRRVATGCAVAAALVIGTASAQVVTINTHTGAVTNGSESTINTVDRRYQQIAPTHVALPKTELDPSGRQALIRVMQSEQGFAMRPFPRGHKGLTLAANGKLEPSGEAYLSMVTSEGLSAKPGDRLVLTDIKIEHSRIIFELNGGPDPKHRFLRHVQIGVGPDVTGPVVQNSDAQDQVGSRLSLTFENHVPELTGADVKALLAPLISFDVKTPIQAFTDTLPPTLKDAILNHHVLVGMSTDMLLFAKGQPDGKSREMEGQMPFEEWIYGKPPKDVEFVRINGNRVIRVEIAKVGEAPEIFTNDVVDGMMRTDGTPLEASAPARTIHMGDAAPRDPDTQAPAAPPSLRNPGETLPADDNKGDRVGVMRPVQFPKPKPDDESEAQPDAQQTPKSSGQGTSTPAATPVSGQAAPADPSQPAAPAKPQTTPAPASNQPG
jgi:hypothetical protein